MNTASRNPALRAVGRFGPEALFTLALLVALLASACRHADHPSALARTEDALQIGVAQTGITPPVGFRMAGYFGERLATGVHDPLRAKALFLRQSDQQAALVFCDLVGVTLRVTAPARELASRKTGIPVSNILICATHTHTGPLFDDVRYDYFHEAAIARYGEDAAGKIDYEKFLIERLVKVIAEAKATARPAGLEIAIARQEGLSFNRRFWMKNGKVATNPGILNPNIVRPAGPIDPDVPVLVARQTGRRQPSAVVTVFAMHLDTVGGTEYSADYPFYVEQMLKERLGRQVVHLFGEGTCGDINHIDVSRQRALKGFPLTGQIGTTLGKTVLEALPQLQPIVTPALAARSKTLVLPLQEVTPEQVADARERMKLSNPLVSIESVKILDLHRRGKTWPFEVQVFRLSPDTAIVGLPAEIFVELGLAIKQASPFRDTIVISICNDRPNYVPTKKAFSEGGYEVINSRVQPGGGEALVEAAIRLLEELKTERE